MRSISLLVITATICCSGVAFGQEKPAFPAVYVVAVRGECQGDRPFALINGRIVTLPKPFQSSQASQTLTNYPKQTLLTRFADDDAVKADITNELRKSKSIRVVERIEESNLVLHFCSNYWEDTMTSRLSMGGKQIPDLYRIGALAIAVPTSQFSPGAAGYDKAKTAPIWKVDTMEQLSAQIQTTPQGGFKVVPGGPFKEMISAEEIARAFAKEADRIVKQLGQIAVNEDPRRPALVSGKDAGAVARSAAPDEARIDEENRVRIETSLVVVPVSVMDRDGKYVPGLKSEDFTIYEDGIKQEVSDFRSVEMPFHVALVLDMSGSTRYRVDDIQEAAIAFVEQLQPHDQVMVVAFDSLVRVASEFTNDRKQLMRAILRTRSGGSTRAYDALDLVLTERLEKIPGRKAIVIFSDGVDTSSTLAGKDDVIAHMEESGTLLYSIRFDTLADIGSAMNRTPQQVRLPERVKEMYARAADFLMNLAQRSGGRYYDVATIKDTSEAFGRIAEELRRQYLLGYYPANQAPDGTFRKIRVSVDRTEVAVRARDGYRVRQ